MKQLRKYILQLEILLNRHFAPKLKRECKDCGVDKLVLLPEEKEGAGNHEVKWKWYEYIPTGKLTADGKEMKKIALVEKNTGPKELFDYLMQLLGQFAYHSFLTKW